MLQWLFAQHCSVQVCAGSKTPFWPTVFPPTPLHVCGVKMVMQLRVLGGNDLQLQKKEGQSGN